MDGGWSVEGIEFDPFYTPCFSSVLVPDYHPDCLSHKRTVLINGRRL